MIAIPRDAPTSIAVGVPSPPPHPTRNRVRNVTDPMKRDMMIPLQCLADGVICRPMHPGVHEAWVKKGAVSLKIQEGMPSTAIEGAANPRRTHSTRAHCPQCFTACRLICRPRRLALAGS